MIVNNTYVMGDQARAFEQQVLGMTGVEGATMTGVLPNGG